MIRGGAIVYDSLEELSGKGRCCLRVSYFFYTALVLLVASACVLAVGYHVEALEPLRTPAAAILGLSTILAVACGLCTLLIEYRVQDRPCCLRKTLSGNSSSMSSSASSESLSDSENKMACVPIEEARRPIEPIRMTDT